MKLLALLTLLALCGCASEANHPAYYPNTIYMDFISDRGLRDFKKLGCIEVSPDQYQHNRTFKCPK